MLLLFASAWFRQFNLNFRLALLQNWSAKQSILNYSLAFAELPWLFWFVSISNAVISRQTFQFVSVFLAFPAIVSIPISEARWSFWMKPTKLATKVILSMYRYRSSRYVLAFWIQKHENFQQHQIALNLENRNYFEQVNGGKQVLHTLCDHLHEFMFVLLQQWNVFLLASWSPS